MTDEPTAKSPPDAETELAHAPESSADTQAETAPTPESSADSKSEIAHTPKSSPDGRSGTASGPESPADEQPELPPNVEPESHPNAEPESAPDAEPELPPDAEPEFPPDAEPEFPPDAEPEFPPEAGAEPEPTPDALLDVAPESASDALEVPSQPHSPLDAPLAVPSKPQPPLDAQLEEDAKPSRAELQFELARIRTSAALDRTLLAWVRTSLSLICFGFTLARVVHELIKHGSLTTVDEQTPLTLGIGMMILGMFGLIVGSFEHARMVKRLRISAAHFPWSAALWVTLGLIAIGLILMVSLLKDLGPLKESI